MLPDESEHALIERARVEPSAMDRLILRHYERLERLTRRNLPVWMERHTSVEDVLQESFARAIARFDQFQYQGEGSFWRWLSTLSRNYLLSLIDFHLAAKRGGGRVMGLDGQPLTTDGEAIAVLHLLSRGDRSPGQLAADREAVSLMRAVLAQLDAAQFEVIRLRYIEGRGVESTARIMKRTPRAVHQLCYRALRELRERMPRSTSSTAGVAAGESRKIPIRA